VPRIDGPNDPKKTYNDYTHGWVSSKYIQDFLCPEDQELEANRPPKTEPGAFAPNQCRVPRFAQSPIPDGLWGSSREVCNLDFHFNYSNAKFRSRFRSLAYMTVSGNRISFDMVPGDCEVKEFKKISEESSEMKLRCDMKTYPEEAVVTVRIKNETNLLLHFDRGTHDNHLSDLTRKQYIWCRPLQGKPGHHG
jgi:hypothetical protein